jgi:hypothetical protein
MAIANTPNDVATRDCIQLPIQKAMAKEDIPKTTPVIDIIDIRYNEVEVNLKDDILNLLRPTRGPKQMPTMLLYSERGLQIFEQVSTVNEFVND